MGVVYRALRPRAGARRGAQDARARRRRRIYRLKREFRSLSELSHPNLINLYELFCDNDLWFFNHGARARRELSRLGRRRDGR